MPTNTKSARKAAPKKAARKQATAAKKSAPKKGSAEKETPSKPLSKPVKKSIAETDPEHSVTGITKEQKTPTVDTEKLEKDKIARLDEIGVPESKRGENVHEHNVDLQGAIVGNTTAKEVHKKHLAEQTKNQTFGEAAVKSAAAQNAE